MTRLGIAETIQTWVDDETLQQRIADRIEGDSAFSIGLLMFVMVPPCGERPTGAGPKCHPIGFPCRNRQERTRRVALTEFRPPAHCGCFALRSMIAF